MRNEHRVPSSVTASAFDDVVSSKTSTDLGTGEELLLLLLEDAADKLAGSIDGSSLQLAQLGILGGLTLGEVLFVRLGVVLLLFGLLVSLLLGDGRGGVLKTSASVSFVRSQSVFQEPVVITHTSGGLGLGGLLGGISGTLDLGYIIRKNVPIYISPVAQRKRTLRNR